MRQILILTAIIFNLSNVFGQVNLSIITQDSISKDFLSNVKIILIDQRGDTLKNISNQKGSCEFLNLLKGECKIFAEKNSYYGNIILNIDSSTTIYIQLSMKTIITKEVIIKAQKENFNTIQGVYNIEIAQSKQIPASIDDPNRLISNSPSVTITNDFYNFIIVRGNTPTSLIYKVNNIEVPAPNHFATFGSTGGSLSMFKTDAINSLSLYTSGFTSEYGNALAGIFDIKLKNGNNFKRNFKINTGVIGIGINSDGPIIKNKKHSYLSSYRYSSLGLLTALNIKYNNSPLPSYQDFQFNINLNSSFFNKVTFWSLLGNNTNIKNESLITTTENMMYLQGLNLQKNINQNYILNYDALVSYNKSIISENLFRMRNDKKKYNEKIFRHQVILNLIKRDYIKCSFGLIHSIKNYKYNLHSNTINTQFSLNDSNTTNIIQLYNNYHFYIFKKLRLEAGQHILWASIVNKFGIDPRFKINYEIGNKLDIGVALGKYSKMEPIYIYNDKNKGLTYSKSKSINLGLNYKTSEKSNLKVELYYEYLYQIPIGILASGFSSNSSYINIYTIPTDESQLKNNAFGKNKGIEIFYEKRIENNWFVNISTSFLDSKYRENRIDTWKNSRFNVRYNSNLIIGKSIQLNSNKILNISGRFSANGGQFFEAVNITESKNNYYTVFEKELGKKSMPYNKIDFQISYIQKFRKVSLEYKIDIINILNTKNMINQYYDFNTNSIKNTYMLGFIPVINITAEF